MRAPTFWWQPTASVAATLLRPVGAIYGGLTAHRMARPGWRAPVPVICIGNLVAGGAGKTPTAIAIARLLIDMGHRPAFLSRGYGRRNPKRDPFVVDPDHHAAEDCGDEPLLLARVAPTIVAADRLTAARLAIEAGADVLVLDDGLQNPALLKDVSIAVVDGGSGIGNGLCLPAGPLRAPIMRQWRFVSMLCVIGGGQPGEAVAGEAERAGIPVTTGRLDPDMETVAMVRHRRLLAFAGIGRPEKFFATLDALGLTVADRLSFPDHHVYGRDDLARLTQAAEQIDATLITTEKDRVRLPPRFETLTLPVRLAFDDTVAIQARLAEAFSRG
ncbi:tetraacyldisaccharide 4'-kinase [Lichenihabitans psoromatis]|uniref:tetraacyldisaccharide 4'-kinase n=1 Tax=Lichenihabitans psoromatis TaxID=2528642 RepID=UPI001035D045|nr:tetraacyldisaccharide 4'-kinase [Lichenihabitans psoromatis]